MSCSICKNTVVSDMGDYGTVNNRLNRYSPYIQTEYYGTVVGNNRLNRYSQYIQGCGGGVICKSCYGEVVEILNFINNNEKSISYPNWGAKWVEGMEARRVREADLADAFRKGIHSDVQVKPSSGLPIPAHRVLLATRSEILKNMLESDSCMAAPEDSISLPDFSYEELDAFLEFLCFGDLPPEKFEKHRVRLLTAADKYDIRDLQKFSEEQFIEQLNSSNALETLAISDAVSNETIKQAALKLIAQQFDEIVSTPNMEEFAKKHPDLMVQIAKANYSREKRT